jgi:rhodanese-related sulfurtransferase
MKKRNLFLTFLAALMVLALPLSAVAGPSIEEVKKNVVNLWKPIKESQPHVTAVEFKKIVDKGKDFILIDVRTKEEYDAAHLPCAIHIDRGLIEWEVPRTIQNTDARIFVYCRTGARSAFATQRLIEMGYTNVTNIYDAFKGWVVAGYAVFNRHGEFKLSPEGFEKDDPYVCE